MKHRLSVAIPPLVALVVVLGVLAFNSGYWPFRSETAIASEPHEQAGLTDPFTIGQFYFNAGDDPSGIYDLKKARRYYEEALTASSTAHYLAWYQLGRIDFLEGKFNMAIYRFNKQIEYFGDKSLPQVRYMLGLTYAYKGRQNDNTEDWRRGAAEFRKFLEFIPDSPWARTDLAWIYFALGEYETMIPILEEGLRHAPGHAWLHNMYGLALLNLEDKEGAHHHFTIALDRARQLTAADWGRAYPGNDPATWDTGLRVFIGAIEKNRALSSE